MENSPKTNVLRDRVLLLLINGMSVHAAESFCLQQGADPAAAREIVADARQRITVAADYTRDEQLGRAIMRLDDLYAKAIAEKDTRTALQALRELNRLLSLYSPKDNPQHPDAEDTSSMRQQLDLIAGHLLPLGLADASYPLEEHARLAAEHIRRMR
jgi:hypothetical protein